MRGKLAEDTKTVVMHVASLFATTTACYGAPVDTKDYDEMQISLNVGAASGPTTLSAILYEDSTGGVATRGVRVTGALFPLIQASSSNDKSVHVASIKCKNYKRYLSLQVMSGAPGSPTIPMSASAILAKGDSAPSGQTLDFDLGD